MVEHSGSLFQILAYLEGGELMLDCFSPGGSPLPANLRERSIEIHAVRPNYLDG
jgi:hypothetical protein